MDHEYLPKALALLEGVRNTAADEALVAALPELTGESHRRALDLLVLRRNDLALRDLVGRFRIVGGTTQEGLVARVRDLFSPVRMAATSEDFDDRAGAIELIVRSGTAELAYLMADALRGSCPKTRAVAAAGLHYMVDQALSRTEAPAGALRASHELDLLAEALRTGVAAWEIHHQPKVIEAALWMSDRLMPAILAGLDNPRARLSGVLCDLVKTARDTRRARFVVSALGLPALCQAAADAIGRARDPDYIRALLAEGWLLDDAEVRRGCRWIRGADWLHTNSDSLLALSEKEAHEAVRLLIASGGSREAKSARFRELLDSGDDHLRTAIVWHLVQDSGVGSDELLKTAAQRGSGVAARIASRELHRRRIDAKPAEAVDGGSPTRRAFAHLWDQYEKLKPEDGTRLLAIVGGGHGVAGAGQAGQRESP